MNVIKFKHLIVFFSFCASLLFLASGHAAVPEVGKSYYTKHGLFFEKGRHITTNYGRGEFMPANSEVQVNSIKGKRMVIVYKGQEITIENVAKHTNKTIEEFGDLFLSTAPVMVGGQFAKDISHGMLRLGMTKAEALMARGYPPAHKTPDTDYDVWVYWSSRFVQMSVVFENGRLVQGRGLR